MMKLLCPKEITASVTHLDLEALWRRGIRGFLMDLDNTLVGWDSDQLTEEFQQWIKRVQEDGFKLCLVSNGIPSRVQRFAAEMGIPAVVRAFKPRRRPFYKAMQRLDLTKSQVAMIGDQVFTDVFGANRIGIYTILINPLSVKELKSTRFVRKIEGRMLRRFVKKGWIPSEAVLRRNGGF